MSSMNGNNKEIQPRWSLDRGFFQRLIRSFSLGGSSNGKYSTALLPRDATDLAQKYSRELAQPGIRQPLEDFLRTTTSIPGLQAIALIIWRESRTPTSLAVYAMGDLTKLRGNGHLPDEDIRAAISAAHAPLWRAMRQTAPLVAAELAYVDTRGEELSIAIPRFQQALISDRFISPSITGEQLCTLTIATRAEYSQVA